MTALASGPRIKNLRARRGRPIGGQAALDPDWDGKSLGSGLARLHLKRDGEAILLTTPRDSDNRKSCSPLSLALGCLAALISTLAPGTTAKEKVK
jgi:hypothetical protein